jgi:hypothetical protein
LRLSSLARGSVLVGLIYGSAILSLALAELFLAKHVSPETFGAYFFVRTGAPLAVIIALAGLDQVIPRRFLGDDARTISVGRLARAVWPATIVGFLAGLLSSRVFGLPVDFSVALAVMTPILAISELTASIYRARRRYGLASALQQGYRFFGALGLVWVSIFRPSGDAVAAVLAGSAIVVSIFGGCLLWQQSTPDQELQSARLHRWLGIGIPVAASSLLTGAQDWVDLAALSARTDGLAASGLYGPQKLLLVMPFVGLASILGFVALPEIARSRAWPRPMKTLERTLLLCCAGVLLSIVLVAIVGGVGAVILRLPPDAWQVAFLLGAGVARLAYVIPSATLGAHGSSRRIWVVVAGSAGFVGLEAAMILTLPIDPITAACSALFVACWGRLTLSLGVACFRVPIQGNQAVPGVSSAMDSMPGGAL